MSSQSENSTSFSGYGVNSTTGSFRDASDYIRAKREARKFFNYKISSTDNKETEPVWLKYGNQFRLAYSFGRYKCTDCNGNAFSGKVGDETPII